MASDLMPCLRSLCKPYQYTVQQVLYLLIVVQTATTSCIGTTDYIALLVHYSISKNRLFHIVSIQYCFLSVPDQLFGALQARPGKQVEPMAPQCCTQSSRED